MGKARSRTHLENRIYDLASDAKASCADKRWETIEALSKETKIT